MNSIKEHEKVCLFRAGLEQLEKDYALHRTIIEKKMADDFQKGLHEVRDDLYQAMSSGKWEKENFNIFKILGVARYEFFFSNMIAWLMDPFEGHGLKDRFLFLFLREIEIKEIKSFSYVRVVRELCGPTSTPDIVVDLHDQKKHFSIIIENKIEASEGEKQLTRQFEDFKKRADEVYFVKIGGETPSLKPFIHLTYNRLVGLLLELKPSSKTKYVLDQFIEITKEIS
jgi:hypothetical protein